MKVTAYIATASQHKLCQACACGRALGGETFHDPRGTCAICGKPLNPEAERRAKPQARHVGEGWGHEGWQE